MKYKDIEAMRQFRLMFTCVVVPTVTAILAVDAAHPELKYKISYKVEKGVENIKDKFNKKKFKIVK